MIVETRRGGGGEDEGGLVLAARSESVTKEKKSTQLGSVPFDGAPVRNITQSPLHMSNQTDSAGRTACGTVRYGTVRYGTVRFGTVRYGKVRCDAVRHYVTLLSGAIIIIIIIVCLLASRPAVSRLGARGRGRGGRNISTRPPKGKDCHPLR